MKQISIALLTLFVLAGCSNNETKSVTKMVTVTADTTVNMQLPKVFTSPRYGCDGRRLKQDKLDGVAYQTTPTQIRLTRTVPVTFNCSEDSTSNSVGGGSSSGSTHNGNSSDWFWDLLKILLAAAAIILFLYLLRRFVKDFGGSTTPAGGGASSLGKENTKTSSGPTAPPFTSTTVSESKTGWEGATAFLTQFQQTGGKAKFGDLKLNIPPQGDGINIIVKAKGDISGDVLIDVKKEEKTSLSITENPVSEKPAEEKKS
jgi:hypothetical protein